MTGFGVYTAGDGWKPEQLTPQELEKMLIAEPERRPFTMDEYKAAKVIAGTKGHAQQKRAAAQIEDHKQRACYVPCYFDAKQGRRGCKNRPETFRQLITFDIDETPEGTTLKDLKKRLRALPVRLTWHTTFSHTPERPRIRVVAALSEKVDALTFPSLSRAIADDWGLSDILDPVSHRTEQVMFYGSITQDGEHAAGVLNKTKAAAINVDDYRDRMTTPKPQERTADCAATAKGGYIGAFNKIHDPASAVDAYGLPFDVVGTEVYWNGYHKKAGDYFPNDEMIQFYNTNVEITGGESSRQFSAYDLVLYYEFGNDRNAFHAHLKAEGVKRDKIKKDYSKDFANFVEEDATSDEKTPPARAERKATKTTTKPNKALKTSNNGTWTTSDPWEIINSPMWAMTTPQRGEPKTITCQSNIDMILLNYAPTAGIFKYDEATNRIYLTRRNGIPWQRYSNDLTFTDSDLLGFLHLISTQFGQRLRKSELADMIGAHCMTYSSEHSGMTWFENLPKPRKRFDYYKELQSYYKFPDTPLNRKVLRANLIIAAARFANFEPENEAFTGWQNMVVLEGANGIGKGHMFKRIAPRVHGLSSYKSVDDPRFTENKDIKQELTQAMIVEFDEMKAFSGNVGASWKSFRSQTYFEMRKAFARESKRYALRGTYWGSTNEPLKADLSQDRTILVLKTTVTTSTADYKKDWGKFGRKMWATIKQELLDMKAADDYSSIMLTPEETAEMVRLNFTQAYEPLAVQEYGDYLDMPIKDKNGKQLTIKKKTLDKLTGAELLKQYQEFTRADDIDALRTPRPFCSPKELAIVFSGALEDYDTATLKEMQLVLKHKGYKQHPNKNKYFVNGERCIQWTKRE